MFAFNAVGQIAQELIIAGGKLRGLMLWFLNRALFWVWPRCSAAFTFPSRHTARFADRHSQSILDVLPLLFQASNNGQLTMQRRKPTAAIQEAPFSNGAW